jgi:cell division protein FtsZ
VPASVFDDDFFKTPVPRFTDAPIGRAEAAVHVSAPEPRVPRHYSGVTDVQPAEVRSVALPPVSESQAPMEQLVRAGSFAAPAGVETERAEPDELDIPAFLRRGNA